MTTAYDVGQTIRLPAVITGIDVDEDGEIGYLIRFSVQDQDDETYYTEEQLKEAGV